MRMNDFSGKELLAAVREKDYAHAGEEVAIDLVFEGIEPDSNRRLLDAGCGRGGTASYVNKHGFGDVVGIDIDAQSIDYASKTYPNCQYLAAELGEVGNLFPHTFDIVYMFNVYYAVGDKAAAMSSLRNSAKNGALLLIFDYVTYKPEVELPDVLSGSPATLAQFSNWMAQAGWQLQDSQNLDQRYVEWYQEFLQRLDRLAAKEAYPESVIQPVRKKYSDLLNALETGALGGAILRAVGV
jgi:cyclopropane fatty-acyl-phospholipid synthase-like methyltransferase